MKNETAKTIFYLVSSLVLIGVGAVCATSIQYAVNKRAQIPFKSMMGMKEEQVLKEFGKPDRFATTTTYIFYKDGFVHVVSTQNGVVIAHERKQ